MRERVALLDEVTRAAGRLLAEIFRENVDIRHKGHVDLVTEADERAEKLIVDAIGRHFPEDHILAEESGCKEGRSAFAWIIDPLDGTTNFAHKFGHFAVSIALMEGGHLIEGRVYDPIKEEYFAGSRGKGASCNGIALKIRPCCELRKALTVTGFPYDRASRTDTLLPRVARALIQCRGLRRLGSAALDLCYVAAGRFDLYFEDSLNSWDIAAGIVIAQEAGALVTDFDGRDPDLNKGEVVVCDPQLHQMARAMVLGA